MAKKKKPLQVTSTPRQSLFSWRGAMVFLVIASFLAMVITGQRIFFVAWAVCGILAYLTFVRKGTV